ncbi:serine--tRNA ligase [Flaviflexus equikiangi]|uniref:Serine--tRNA ligase n=1 Tax=Flaviflexus equikiangi TaxID=2758573 RepID=A0ABS2TCB5_9ACTO|nr:serine--tRNA ligase [Flaviflexus equikiangi]MBM9432267.1 serine--tRNA ligase [Flaviflexus equikiangi]
MIDIRYVRENPEAVKASQRARGANETLVDDLLRADEARRSTLQVAEETRAQQKALSRTVGKASAEERPTILAQAQELAAKVRELEDAAAKANAEYERIGMLIPNIIVDGVPSGGEDDYVVLKHVGDVPTFDFPVKDHLDLAEGIRAIDMARGTKVSGSRFYYLTGIGARLELALLTAAADLAEANGFTLTVTPTLVKPEVMAGTGFLGAHADEIYHLETDDLYLVGTSEVALAGFHSDEIIDLSDGPKRYAGWSTCYRREAGSYGKDTRGIIRVHQFNKVEMFSYCTPDDAENEHARLLDFEEQMLAKVELPYRVIDTAAGDLGSSAARKFDCEAWLPSQERWMEVTSTSNCTTFQARRLSVREKVDGKTQTVATLNGTLATTRWLVAILENHQREDGSIYVPEGLRPYLGGRELISVQ